MLTVGTKVTSFIWMGASICAFANGAITILSATDVIVWPLISTCIYYIYNNLAWLGLAMADDCSPERSSGEENPVPRRSPRLAAARRAGRGAAPGRQGTRPAGRGELVVL